MRAASAKASGTLLQTSIELELVPVASAQCGILVLLLRCDAISDYQSLNLGAHAECVFRRTDDRLAPDVEARIDEHGTAGHLLEAHLEHVGAVRIQIQPLAHVFAQDGWREAPERLATLHPEIERLLHAGRSRIGQDRAGSARGPNTMRPWNQPSARPLATAFADSSIIVSLESGVVGERRGEQAERVRKVDLLLTSTSDLRPRARDVVVHPRPARQRCRDSKRIFRVCARQNFRSRLLGGGPGGSRSIQ